MTPWPRPDKVYFITTSDRSMVKIGSSRNPAKRLESCMTWSPIRLEIIAVAPGSYAEEFALHRLFKAYHSHFEWFRGASEIFDAADLIHKNGAIPPQLLVLTEGPIPNRQSRRRKVTPQQVGGALY